MAWTLELGTLDLCFGVSAFRVWAFCPSCLVKSETIRHRNPRSGFSPCAFSPLHGLFLDPFTAQISPRSVSFFLYLGSFVSVFARFGGLYFVPVCQGASCLEHGI